MVWRRLSTLLAAAAGAALGCSLVVGTSGLATGGAEPPDAAPDSDPSDAPRDDGLDGGTDGGAHRFGLPTPISTTLTSPSSVVADRDHVYVLTDSAVLSFAATGGGTPATLVQSLKTPLGLTAGSSSIFFANGESSWTYVYGVPKAGGAATRPYGNGAGETRIPAVSAEAHSVAFLNVPSGGARDVIRGSEDGTSSLTVAPAQVGASTVLLRAPYVYWTTANGILRSDGAAPQAPEVFATDATGVTELVADDTTLYWCPTDGKLRALRFDQPGMAPVILESGLRAPHGFAVDTESVYWASPVTGEVRATPKAGGASIVVASGQPDPWAVAANDAAVFFTNRAAGTLFRVPKP